jgi:hypothetical protein
MDVVYSALVGAVATVLEAFAVLLVDVLRVVEPVLVLLVEDEVCEAVLEVAEVFTELEVFCTD